MNITRKDYMDNKVTHAEYYRAIAKTAGISYAKTDPQFLNRVKEALEQGDEHLNTIPLSTWDSRADSLLPFVHKAFKVHGDFPTQAGLVCLIKRAAKDAVLIGEEHA